MYKPKNRGNRYRDPNDFALSCRIFVGNLASERTSREELTEVFSKYGGIVDIVVRKSFGFVQFESPEAAQNAIAGENGRMLGGLNLDLNMADSRDKERERENKEKGVDGRKRRMGGDISRSHSPPHKRITHRKLVQVIYLGMPMKGYGKYVEAILRERLPKPLEVESVLVESRSVDETIQRADERAIKYVIVVGKRHEDNRVVSLHVLRGGQSEAIEDVFLLRAVELVCLEEGLPVPNQYPLPPYDSMLQAELVEAFRAVFGSQPDLVDSLANLLFTQPELAMAFSGASQVELVSMLANPQTANILQEMARVGNIGGDLKELMGGLGRGHDGGGGRGGYSGRGGEFSERGGEFSGRGGRSGVMSNTGMMGGNMGGPSMGGHMGMGGNMSGNMGGGPNVGPMGTMGGNVGMMGSNMGGNIGGGPNMGGPNMGGMGMGPNVSTMVPNMGGNMIGGNMGSNMGGGMMGGNVGGHNIGGMDPMGGNMSSGNNMMGRNMRPNMGSGNRGGPFVGMSGIGVNMGRGNMGRNMGGNMGGMGNNLVAPSVGPNVMGNVGSNLGYNPDVLHTLNATDLATLSAIISNNQDNKVSDLVNQQANLQANVQNLINKKQPSLLPTPSLFPHDPEPPRLFDPRQQNSHNGGRQYNRGRGGYNNNFGGASYNQGYNQNVSKHQTYFQMKRNDLQIVWTAVNRETTMRVEL